MPVDRPTFSESWYRVAELRPRLLPALQIHRQHFRGQLWHVVQDPSNNQYFRLNLPAYQFVAMLDGRRTVAAAWQVCNETLGDSAPTQNEVIQLLGQLYTSNLLQGDLPPDADGLFQRYKKRVRRELTGYLTNFLFLRLPLLDPDHFLDAIVGPLGWLFSWVGLALWLVLAAIGGSCVLAHWPQVFSEGSSAFNAQNLSTNLPLLYASFVLAKVVHEFGHALACKKFGRREGGTGEVHVMGVMMLVFMPMPYVDASSSWAFRSKWRRVIVGAAGMLAELALAAVATVVWANSGETSPIHAVAYNLMFLASVTTLLFNGNPLLRYDAYYMLSDLVEIPNLQQRSRDYIYYLVKRYAWSIKPLRNPAVSHGEKVWLVVYGIASTIYRVFISVAIILFIGDKLYLVGAIMAVGAVVAWVIVPTVKYAHYLSSSPELSRVRGRAVGSTLAVVFIAICGIGIIRMPDRQRVEGIVEPVRISTIYADADGFVQGFAPSCSEVTPGGPPVVTADNPVLRNEYESLLKQREILEAQRDYYMDKEPAAVQNAADKIATVDGQIAKAKAELDSLVKQAPFTGRWVCELEQIRGKFIRRGEKLGTLADPTEMIIRAAAGQEAGPLLLGQAGAKVEIMVEGRPEQKLTGTVLAVLPARQDALPSPALGAQAGGLIPTAGDDQSGVKAAERFFEIRIAPDFPASTVLRPRQRVMVRFSLPEKPLVVQWWRQIQQVLLKRN